MRALRSYLKYRLNSNCSTSWDTLVRDLYWGSCAFMAKYSSQDSYQNFPAEIDLLFWGYELHFVTRQLFLLICKRGCIWRRKNMRPPVESEFYGNSTHVAFPSIVVLFSQYQNHIIHIACSDRHLNSKIGIISFFHYKTLHIILLFPYVKFPSTLCMFNISTRTNIQPNLTR